MPAIRSMSSPVQATRHSPYPRIGGPHVNPGNDPNSYPPLSPQQNSASMLYQQQQAQQNQQQHQYRLQRTISVPGQMPGNLSLFLLK